MGKGGNALFTFLFEFLRLPTGNLLWKVNPAPVGDGAERADRKLTCLCRSDFLAFCTINPGNVRLAASENTARILISLNDSEEEGGSAKSISKEEIKMVIANMA